MEWEIRTQFWRRELKDLDNVIFQILNVIRDFSPYPRDQSLGCSSIMILILTRPFWVLLLLIILFPALYSLQNHRLNHCQGPLTVKCHQTAGAFQCSCRLRIWEQLCYRFWSVLHVWNTLQSNWGRWNSLAVSVATHCVPYRWLPLEVMTWPFMKDRDSESASCEW